MLFEVYGNEPPRCDGLTALLREMCALYGRGEVLCAGSTLLGRPIPVVALGNMASPVLMAGGVHGSEWLTVLLLLRFAEDVLHSLQCRTPLAGADLERCLARRGLLILPCLNPDGTEISLHGPGAAGRYAALAEDRWRKDTPWQANARGVDLNHNFDAGWQELRELERREGILCPGPTRFGGEHPHSEPETRAAVSLCRGRNVAALYTFHSQGEEIYYHYGPRTPQRARLMARLLAGCCGYRVAHPTGTAAHGGFKDWFIRETGRPGFTFEIGRGKNPLPVGELLPIYARLQEALTAAVVL